MRSRAGFALVYALVVVAIVSILALGTAFKSVLSLHVGGNDRNATIALSLSETGLHRYKTILRQSHEFIRTNWADYDLDDDQLRSAFCGDWLSLGIDLDRLPGTSGKLEIDVGPGGSIEEAATLPDGTPGGYRIELSVSGRELTSTGWVGPSLAAAKARAVTRVALQNGTAGAYENAVFTRGFNGPMINGNVSVYGSIHGVDPDYGPSDTAISFGGTAGVYNSYAGESGSSDARTRVQRMGGDPNLPDLCASVKLKSGNFELTSGSAAAGTVWNPMRRAAFGNGGVSGLTTGFHLDGEFEAYDDQLDLEMPQLDAAYPDEFGGAAIDLATGCSVSLFARGGLAIPPSSGTTCTSPDGGARVVFATGRPAGMRFEKRGADGIWRLATDEGVVVNAGANDLAITDSIAYRGHGTLRAGTAFSPQDVYVDGDLVPASGRFLRDGGDRLGIVSNRDLAIGTSGSPRAEVAAVLYTRQQATLARDVLVLGAIVADQVSAGSQVPSVAYDPAVKNNLPVGVPFSEETRQLRALAYERR